MFSEFEEEIDIDLFDTFIPPAAVAVLGVEVEILKLNSRSTIEATSLIENPLVNGFYDHSGDFIGAYGASIYVASILDLADLGIPERVKNVISLVAGVATTLLAELPNLPYHLSPKAEIWDIPAGIAGSLAYMGIRYIARERFISQQLEGNTIPPYIV